MADQTLYKVVLGILGCIVHRAKCVKAYLCQLNNGITVKPSNVLHITYHTLAITIVLQIQTPIEINANVDVLISWNINWQEVYLYHDV